MTGLLAEFGSPDALLDALDDARRAGYSRLDAFTPFPIEGLAERIGFRERRVPWLALLGGGFGAALGFGMQVYVNLDYPLNVGGRAVISTPAFLVVSFELMILFAVLFAIVGMLALDRLPRLHHPLFDAERFHLASVDRFFLYVGSDDPRFDRAEAAAFLRGLGAASVTEVGA